MDGRIAPSEQGARSEAAVASALVRSGREVYLPVFSAHGRVDLVYEGASGYVGVQCKTARIVREVLVFMTCSKTGNVPKTYNGQVDEFGVYSPDTGLVYLLPADELPTRLCSLRLTPTRNGQAVGVRWAKDYELGPP
jgi:hypothetical protein